MSFLWPTAPPNRAQPGTTLQVIGAGLYRCGTTSLKEALESPHLDLSPCFHMAEVAPYPERQRLTIACLRERDKAKRQKMLYKLFDGYAATTDFPGWFFLEDLMEMYPNAKVVLNQRIGGDVENWSKSCRDAFQIFYSQWYRVGAFPYQMNRLQYGIMEAGRDRIMERWGVESLWSPTLYSRYNEWARQTVKKQDKKLLEWTAKDGWDPLCDFLNVERPAKGTPFPKAFNAKEMQILQAVLFARGLLTWGVLMSGVYLAWRCWPSMVGWAGSLVR